MKETNKRKGYLQMLKKHILHVVLLQTLSGLSGCTTNISGDFCLIYEPIYADYVHDTAETIRQIDRNNIVYDELCTEL